MAKKQSKASKRKAKQDAEKKRNSIIIAVVAVVFAIIAFLVFGSDPSGGEAPLTENGLPDKIDAETGYQMLQDGAFLLDVRTQPEWEEYHVEGATMVVLDELESRVSEVPFHQDIIIMCNSGNRSQVARDILLEAGYPNVTSIAGGIQGWMSAGYDVVTGP